MNIALIGPRGVGKSKISRKLSKLTGLSVVSTDMIAVYELGGISIADYIKKGGSWKRFRDLEFQILQKLKDADSIILDCGGGILFDLDQAGQEIESQRKIQLLKSFTKIIGLSQKTSYLLEKIKNDNTRPALSELESYEAILKRRLPTYEKVSDHYLDIYDMEMEKVAKWILSDFF